VALFNFVPLLPLDGGHVAAAMYEAIRRSLARVFGRPDPGHVDTARLLPIAYVVGGIILISGAVLILADIIDPIRLF
jgi:membrane-associated protease RseP (regulator of RpoE activity)